MPSCWGQNSAASYQACSLPWWRSTCTRTCVTGRIVGKPETIQKRASRKLADWYREVGLGTVTAPLGILQSEVVVHRSAESLLAAEIALSCLNRRVPKQKLNLLKFSARLMA